MPGTSEPGLRGVDRTRGRSAGLPTPAFLPRGPLPQPGVRRAGLTRPAPGAGGQLTARSRPLGRRAGPWASAELVLDLLSVGRADLGGWPGKHARGPSWSSLWALCELPAVCLVPAAPGRWGRPAALTAVATPLPPGPGAGRRFGATRRLRGGGPRLPGRRVGGELCWEVGWRGPWWVCVGTSQKPAGGGFFTVGAVA